jgi:hypothetical protein
MRKSVLLTGLGLVMVVVNVGCVTTRVMDKEGRVVSETTRWEPVVVSPVVYDGPVEYVDGPTQVVVRERYPIIVERPYYRPVRVYYEPRRTVYIGHRPHHRHRR